MKPINFLFMLMMALVMSSCEKYSIDGGPIHIGIYVFTGENEELVLAHDYEYEIPAAGGTFNLQLVSYGLKDVQTTKKCDGIAASFEYQDPIPEEYAFDEAVGGTRYLQSVTIVADRNSRKRSKEFKFIVGAEYAIEGIYGAEAEITVKQAGK